MYKGAGQASLHDLIECKGIHNYPNAAYGQIEKMSRKQGLLYTYSYVLECKVTLKLQYFTSWEMLKNKTFEIKKLFCIQRIFIG